MRPLTHEMCPSCECCQHCSRSRMQLESFWIDCTGGVTHRHYVPQPLSPDFRPYVPEWAVPLGRVPHDAA